MKIIFPDNIFAKFFANSLKEIQNIKIDFKESALCSNELINKNYDLALIPSCDLIKHNKFFVSKKIAISFDQDLSNSYFYFIPNQTDFKEIFFTGNISSNEVILSKILFKEKYATDIQINLEAGNFEINNKNYLLAGDKNFQNGNFVKGLSFADEISSLLFLPYVSFVLVSENLEKLKEFHKVTGDLDLNIEMKLSEVLSELKLDLDAENFILENFGSVSYEVSDVEADALKELLQLPYFHGITDQIFDVIFVE